MRKQAAWIPSATGLLSWERLMSRKKGVVLANRFEAILNIDVHLTEQNVLIHRLTPQQLRGGRELRETYSRFLRFIRSKPLWRFMRRLTSPCWNASCAPTSNLPAAFPLAMWPSG